MLDAVEDAFRRDGAFRVDQKCERRGEMPVAGDDDDVLFRKRIARLVRLVQIVGVEDRLARAPRRRRVDEGAVLSSQGVEPRILRVASRLELPCRRLRCRR